MAVSLVGRRKIFNKQKNQLVNVMTATPKMPGKLPNMRSLLGSNCKIAAPGMATEKNFSNSLKD